MCDKGTHCTLSSWGERKGEGGSVRSHSAKKEDEEAVTQGTCAGSTSRYLTGKVPRAATLPGGPASAFLRMPAAHPVGAAQPRSPRPRDLHHVTRRIQPRVAPRSREEAPPTESGSQRQAQASSAQVGKLRPAVAEQGAEPRWGAGTPRLLLAQTIGPHCPPGSQGAGVTCRWLQISGSASYQLCDLWKVTSPLSSLCHHLEMEQKCFLRRCAKNLKSLLSFLSFS